MKIKAVADMEMIDYKHNYRNFNPADAVWKIFLLKRFVDSQ